MLRDITYVFYVLQPGGKGAIPEQVGGMDVGMDMGVVMGGCIDGGAKWPENRQAAAGGVSE